MTATTTQHPPFDFAIYLRDLRQGTVDDQTADAAWHSLRAALCFVLKKRGLLENGPRSLGIVGRSWYDEDALDELLADCYHFIFVDRQSNLQKHLLANGDIHGLIFRNINNFLYDRQKRYDPIGFHAVSRLREAIHQLIDAGVLYVRAGDPKIRNDTRLSFNATGTPDSALRPELEEQAQLWIDRLLPELITARGDQRLKVVSKLAEYLSRLPRESGIEAFRFGDVASPFRSKARACWDARRQPWTKTSVRKNSGSP